MTESDYSSQLNRQQYEAVRHSKGPLLILAGAGSGKTRTITYKIAYLIDKGVVTPDRILAVTFTNKAASEMKSRVEQLLDCSNAPSLICTFHSLGARLLRKHAQHLGYGRDFTICDVDDQKRLLKRVYTDLGFRDEDVALQRTRQVISHSKNQGWSPSDYQASSLAPEAEWIYQIFEGYQKLLHRSNAVDFDDLILLTVKLFKDNASIRERYGRQFRYLLIDEYQDTNAPQYDLIKQLACVHQNVSAVGDEDQSIYGFRGADISNILRFESDFPGARIIKLEQNYRSTQNILDAATAVVSNNVARKDKVLWTESQSGEQISVFMAEEAREEALFVANQIRQYLDRGSGPVAVLYRTNFQSRQFEEALRRYSIPYSLVGSLSFYRRKEVRDGLAYLRVAVNPHDDISLSRILNEPPRGIGQVTRSKLQGLAGDRGGSIWQSLKNALDEQLFPGRTHAALKRFRELVARCRLAVQEMPLHLALETILEASNYMTVLQAEDTEEANNRVLNLQELITVARDYEGSDISLQEFLDQAALHADADDFDESADVTLMTLHNAKGLEFPVVFLAGCEEGLFPHSRAIVEDDLEEERRLCYVGLTRAQKKLYLSFSRRRRFFGRDNDEINRPSRFLHEIPPTLIEDLSWGSSLSPTVDDRRPAQLDYESLKTPRVGNRVFSGKTYNSASSVKRKLRSGFGKGRNSGLVAGAIVVHRKFGKGRVLKVEETGGDLKVSVQFPGTGIKKMLQSLAKLKLA